MSEKRRRISFNRYTKQVVDAETGVPMALDQLFSPEYKDLLQSVLVQLDYYDVGIFEQTSKQAIEFVQRRHIWQKLYQRDFPRQYQFVYNATQPETLTQEIRSKLDFLSEKPGRPETYWKRLYEWNVKTMDWKRGDRDFVLASESGKSIVFQRQMIDWIEQINDNVQVADEFGEPLEYNDTYAIPSRSDPLVYYLLTQFRYTDMDKFTLWYQDQTDHVLGASTMVRLDLANLFRSTETSDQKHFSVVVFDASDFLLDNRGVPVRLTDRDFRVHVADPFAIVTVNLMGFDAVLQNVPSTIPFAANETMYGKTKSFALVSDLIGRVIQFESKTDQEYREIVNKWTSDDRLLTWNWLLSYLQIMENPKSKQSIRATRNMAFIEAAKQVLEDVGFQRPISTTARRIMTPERARALRTTLLQAQSQEVRDAEITQAAVSGGKMVGERVLQQVQRDYETVKKALVDLEEQYQLTKQRVQQLEDVNQDLLIKLNTANETLVKCHEEAMYDSEQDRPFPPTPEDLDTIPDRPLPLPPANMDEIKAERAIEALESVAENGQQRAEQAVETVVEQTQQVLEKWDIPQAPPPPPPAEVPTGELTIVKKERSAPTPKSAQDGLQQALVKAVEARRRALEPDQEEEEEDSEWDAQARIIGQSLCFHCGKSSTRICSCNQAHYCSEHCAQENWKEHQFHCNAFIPSQIQPDQDIFIVARQSHDHPNGVEYMVPGLEQSEKLQLKRGHTYRFVAAQNLMDYPFALSHNTKESIVRKGDVICFQTNNNNNNNCYSAICTQYPQMGFSIELI